MENWSALFDGQTRYFLEINNSPVQPEVLRFRGREALSEPFTWDIEFTTPQANIAPEQVLMKYASFRMRSGKNVHGIITRLDWLSTTKDQSHYRVTLSSRLALLGYTRQCAVYQDQSVPEVVEQVLRKHGLEGADFEFRLERSYPVRELITQWRETDLQFIRRILSEVGIFWRTEMDNTRELDVFIFADSQLNYCFDVRLPYREPSGLFDGAAESVWEVRTWHDVVTGTVATRDYNYRTATTPLDATVRVRNDAVTTGDHYRYATPYRDAGDDTDPTPETESGAFYARLHHERELNHSARVHLFSNASGLTPGQVLEPQGEVITALKEGVSLTLVTFRGARDSRLHVSVWGMPYTERYSFRPPEFPRPEIHGTLPARIESREKNAIYAHLDSQGRYRVKLDFDRDGTERGYGYLWLRMAKPYAGDTLGWHTPLTDGTEVAIAYSNGDIDLPYIAYALHDSEHPDHVTRDNSTRNVLRTPTNNKLRLEDKRGEEHLKLATEYGKTQLSGGHLVDAQEKPRGKGFELRTDERGVIRVAKGLFITADGQQKAAGEVLDMDTALREIEICQNQLKALEMAAEQAQALQADIASQSAMFSQRLKPLNDMIHFHGPEGVAFSSGEHMQLAAAENVAINAGGDISAGVMGNMTALAGDKIGLFARTGELSLKAGEGPIEMKALNGNLRLFAEKKLTITSESDISFAGKKRITLIGGGSYLRLEAGKVEYGTTATYMRRVKRTMLAAPIAMNNSLPGESQLSGMVKNQSSDKGQDKLTTQTVISIPADRSRRRIGVGEQVTLTCSSPVSAWSISPSSKAKVQTLSSNSAVLTAFDKAGNVTVIATTSNGKNSVQFTIVEPSAFVMNRVAGTDLIHHNGSPDCGWLGRPYLHPVDVNFAAVSIRERDSQAVGTGAYKVLTGRWHGRYNPSDPKNGTSQWFRIDVNEYSTIDGSTLSSAVTDTIFAGIGDAAGIKPPFTHCTLSMPIVWEWTIDRATVHSFPTNEQKHEIFADGKCTTSKASHKETTLYNDPDSGLAYIKR